MEKALPNRSSGMGPRSHWKCLHQVRRYYTVALGLARASNPMLQPSDAAAQLSQLASALGLDQTFEMGSRSLGIAVASSRTSWVRRVRILASDYFVKTYDYATLGARLRGALRNTGPLQPSRARREAAALSWLRTHGFAAPEPVGWEEFRTFGLLRRAILVTAAFPGRRLDAVLRELQTPARAEVGVALGVFVARLHAAGFRDGNLDLRNLLLHDDRSTLTFAKIDSPKFRLARTGSKEDPWVRADWKRLLPQLAPFALTEIVRDAATAASDRVI